jgi:plasmid maintenance system antidote protein VapI
MPVERNYTAQIIAEHMRIAGLNRSGLATAMDIPKQNVSEIMSGKYGIGNRTAERLAKVFPDTTVDYWLCIGYHGKRRT